MLHAKFLRSPYAYAVVKSVDISKAKALPGVVDILTWEDPDMKAFHERRRPMGSQGPAHARQYRRPGRRRGGGRSWSPKVKTCATKPCG